ncbi:MAG TPA: amidase family protein [Longimicrobiales bacterium]|nr:amidase family protein [Longimicrobiales bacterium]
MPPRLRLRSALVLCLLLPTGAAAQTRAQRRTAPAFDVVETTIARVHEAMRAHRLTARALVQAYLDRIAAYDKQGPALNAIILVNPDALRVADSLDAEYARTGRFAGPLHGIPVIVKDNFETRGLQTTAGSLSLAGYVPERDAYQVRRLREAGAIVLAKSNMAEFAFSPYETVGSMLPGYTRNPYATNRVTAGSSGGTAAAVAASFGVFGLGSDTGNSIRGPSAHQALVGIRSTMGLTSRAGIVPLYLGRDVGGPMARSVADAAAVLDVVAGSDPADPATAEAARHIPREGYAAHLRRDGLAGKRIGVVRQLSDSTADPEVIRRFDEALAVLRREGATVVDSVRIVELDTIHGATVCASFKPDIDAFLAARPGAPVHSLAEIIASNRFHPTIAGRLRSYAEFQGTPETNPVCQEAARNEARLRDGVRRVLAERRLDALVYPTWDNPPRLIGDLNTPDGNNSWQLSPPTGFPALTVPMGWVHGGALPAGLQILGDAWSEPRLIEIAYAFEQATRFRRPPASTPALDRAL